MKSNFDILENHIRLIDTRNRESITDRVLGINIDKFFMPSVANVIGTDLSKYKLITKGKFACNPMHVGRDERLPVALYDEEEPAIVSPAYFMFEVIDNSILNEDYLMMWFRRPEFDRICWLHTDGSVRGGITWDDICRLELPIPPIEKQLEIVNSYKAITERIALKKKINDNLANQISAIYDDYFVQYKCSTVTSYIDSPLGKIPSNYKVLTIGELGCDISDGNYSSKYPKADEFQTVGIPFIRGVDFIGTNISKRNLLYITPEKHNELLKGHTKENDILITTRGVGIGKIAFVPSDMIDVNINSQLIRINGGNTYPRVFLSQSLISNRGKNEIQANVTGSAQPQLPVGNFKNIKIVIPPESQILDFCRICNPLLNAQLENYQEIDVLQKLLDVLLTKLSSR